MSDGPPDLTAKRLDFSEFHATGDHWPFSAYCRTQYGGGWLHLRYAWDYHRRDQMLWPWHRLMCRIGHHDMRDVYQRASPDAPWQARRQCFTCGAE